MRTASLIAGSLLACSLLTAAPEEIDPALFEGIEAHSESYIRLHGIAALYPGHVLFSEPTLEGNLERSEAARVETIQSDITYIRVYRLEAAIEIIEEHLNAPSLILDLRYCQSSELGSTLSFNLDRANAHNQLTAIGKLPAQAMEALAIDVDAAEPVRTTPVVVLCNHETAGAFEAILHNLQSQGAVIGVGESTAGRTGFYAKAQESVWLLNGEIRPNQETSLIGHGFTPRIQVKLSAKENYTAYHWYEAGGSLEQILLGVEPTDSSTNEHETIDPVLERGIEIVAALQILHQP